MARTGIGVLASGRGSNFEALVKAVRRGDIEGDIKVLIANVVEAPVLKRAASLNVPSAIVSHRDFKSRAAFEEALTAELEKRSVELVCLAGFMRILTPSFVGRYANRIMNIHPSLLPAFAGLQGMQVHEAVIAAGAKVSGCTVHFVDENVDAGPIVVQRAIPVRDEDTPETLGVRVLVEEHLAYAEAVRLYCSKRLMVDGRRVKVRAI